MERELKKYLETLNTERYLKKPKEAGIILNKITQFFKQEQSQFTLGLLIGFLLEENNAIFTFIWKTCLDFETVPSANAALKLLDFLVGEFEKSTEPYFMLLFEKCLYLLDTKFASVKELSLKLVKNLVMKDSKNSLDLGYLVEKLEKYISEESIISGTVFEQICSILGYLFEKCPESINGKEKRFFSYICDSLRHEMRFTKNPSVSKIKGAFEGINSYLLSYPPPHDESLKEIYEYVKNFSKFRKEKRAGSRAALKIFQNHGAHFSKFVFDDKDIWRENLFQWMNRNSEDRQCAFNAMNALYSVIAVCIKQDSTHGDVVKNYLRDFEETLQSKKFDSYGKKSALAGIKLFVSTDSLGHEDLRKAYMVVMNFTRNQGYSPDSSSPFSSLFLPLSIESVSAFALKFPNVETMACLQRLCLALINDYPKMEPDFQRNALFALERSFYMLGLCDSGVLEKQIQKVLYQALVRTCSCVTEFDLEFLKETEEPQVDCVTYKSYLGMWEYLLNLMRSHNLPINDSFALKKGVAAKVFDAFIESFLKIIEKLNLNVKVNRTAETESEAEVETPSDVNIFINCVDLYQDLIPLVDSYALSKWLIFIFQTVIRLSHKNPLIAGFYKMLTTTFNVADDLQFFEGENKKLKIFHFLSKFVEEVLVKIDQYKGDLQVVCLQTLLAAPVPLVEPFVEKTVPALEVAVHLGRSYFPLLRDLVDALERWDFHLPRATTSAVMRRILPHFDLFFQSQYFRGNNLVGSSVEGRRLKKKLVFNDSELLVLQKKFLMFIGNLDTSMAMNLIELPQMPEEERKISDKRLCYHPPSGKILLDLEETLARVMELAVSCSDRRTRIASCELLYAAVMIVLSNVNQVSGGYSGLFRKIIKTCLILASDSDSVVYQIFEPLMFQIIRYFSSKKTMYFTETQDVVDILMDFVTRPYDPTARDLSALLICQFTTWSIEQLVPEELAASPESINKVLGEVYSLSVHPSFSKRLGAAVVFNKIYQVLREEDYILDANWFQLFYHFMQSLRMCSGAEDVTEITEAIQHVKRPLVEMADKFNKASQARVVPPEFEGGLLSHLVKWTLTRCCESNPLVRRVSMSLVEELAPLVRDCDSLVSFIDIYFPGKSLLIKNKPFDRSNPAEEHLVDWLNHQTTFFEYYLWLLEQEIFSTDDVSLSEFNTSCNNYVVGVTTEGERSLGVNSSKRESVLAFLNVLLVFKEKAFYFSLETWDLVKLSVLKPSRLGFDVNPEFVSERLTPVLSNLLEHCYLNLTHYAWNRFYEGFEDLMTVPVLHHITRNGSVDVRSWEFLFSLKIIQSSGMWADFLKRSCFSMDGALIVEIIFRSLFVREGKIVCAVSLEPSSKAYLEQLMTVGAKVGVDLNDVAGFLENQEEVREEDTEKIISKGEYFWTQFKHILFQILENQSASLVERTLGHANADAMKLLIQVLENDHEKLSIEIFRRWVDFQRLQDVWPKKVMLDLAVCAAQAKKTPGCLANTAVASFIYSFLENTQFMDMDAEEIESVFDLVTFLPNFCEKADDNPRLKGSLSKFLVDDNAIGEAASQSFSRRNAMGLAMKGLLRGLKLSGSLALLDFILRIGFWFNTFCTRAETESALSVFAELPPDHSSSALDLAYKACLDSKNLCSSMSTLYHWFLQPLMRVSSPEAAYEFVVGNLENFCDLIKVERPESLGGVRKITEKIFAAEILQIFFTRASKEVLGKLPKEKETLIISLIKSFFPLNIKVKPSDVFRERYRKLICQIFNMICAIISAKCTDEKFFRLFVFDKKISLLYAVVDTSCKYNLSMDFEEIPKRKTFSKALRKSASVGVSSRNLIKFIETNTLFSSSLREDVTKFDLFSSSVRPMDSIEKAPDPQVVEIELEVDTLNKHECMATIVGIVTKMVVEGITPLPATPQPTPLPCWLHFFLTALERPESMENFRLFILKALYNLQDYVRPYAEQVFPVMLENILSLLATHPMNYVVIDLIEMMIGWKDLPEATITQDRLLELVELVISKSDSFRKDIIKYNLEVIKTIVEKWKHVLATPKLSGFMFERLIRDTSPVDDGVAYLNIQVCRILLANGIPPWEEGSERRFFDSVLRSFNEENKNKQLFAEVCGLALNLLQRGSIEELEDLVGERISGAASWHSLLYAVHKHYPKITSKFVFQIFSSAWNSDDSLTIGRLEMLLSYVSDSTSSGDATFDRHAHHFLTDMLNSADATVQELSLQIANRLLGRLEDEKREAVMKEALRLQKSADVNVRKRVYELAVNHYPRHREGEGVREQCKVVLLRGLNDPERELEESCLGFWRGFLGSSSPLSTLVKVFREMYTPDTEGIFLSNTVKILIATADAFCDCEKPIFPHPIAHQVKFQKRTLNVSSRRVLPGFMPSRVLTNHSMEHVASLKSQTLAFLRPTTSGSKFAPTVRPASEGAAVEGEETFKKPEIPKNPLRRRFYRSSEKTSGSFAKWQMRKRKKELKEEEEWVRKKETQVDVYGDYRAGDYPDIEISHFQILKPLEALAERDPQVARHFLVSFYSGLMESVSPDEQKTLLSETNACFLRILESSKSFDSGVFGFVFQVLLKHGKGLDVDCERISNAAVSSNWLTLGALLVEQTLASSEHSEAEAKRRRGDETPREKNWMELAKLYRNLEEFDVLSGIFLDKLNVAGDAREAINAEALLDWTAASTHYEAVLEADPDSRRSEFYTESYFSCLAKLSSWSSVNECIRATVDEDLDELWKNYNLLSWFLKSEIMVALTSERSEFRGVPEELSNTKAKLDVLAANFGEELAVFDWLSGNVQKANYGIDRLCLDFLAGWSHLNKWSYNLRAAKLSGLQTVAELGFAVKSLAERSKSGLEQNLKTGTQRWEKSVPARWDDLGIWDIRLKYREKFLSELKEFDVTSAAVKSNLKLAKAALAQRNINLAKEVLSRVKGKLTELDTDLKAEYDHCFNLGKMVVAELKMGDLNAGLEMYLNVWRSIARQVSSAMETESETSTGHLFRCLFTLGQLVSSILPFVKKQEQLSPKVLESICAWVISPPGSLVQTLENKSLEYLETAKDISESLDASAQSTAYLELGRCLLKLSHSDTFSGFEKLGKYLLRAMRLGSPEARRLFGCLLSKSQVVTTDDSFDDLVAEGDSVPSWMYLMWLNQILANLNSGLFPLLKAVVSKIAEDYPNAIRYPFRLTRFESARPDVQFFAKKLSNQLSDGLYENFLISVNYLGPPDLILRSNLESVLKEVEKDDPDYSRVKSILTQTHQLMFSSIYEKFRGPIFNYWEMFKNPLERLLEAEEKKDVLQKKIRSLAASIEISQGPSKRTLRYLESYSPWLRSFHCLREGAGLELPGQYDGSRRPIGEHLVTVSCFKNEVLLFDSKCRPMRISILGNDAVEHRFLVKFGEDLRQDERIQQVFGHFNYTLNENKQTRRFSVNTYKVIPLTFTLGMIEWIDNNVSLYEMMESSLGNEAELISRAQTQHLQFLAQGLALGSAGPMDGSVAAHLNAYASVRRELAVTKFKAMVQAFPRDLLRKSFWALSKSPEQFIYLRANFAASHAVMCLTHWLVGIGDRHLQNTLVSTITGRVLGIDFGYAFGFATQFLVPPELIPFRLTPQILNLLHPLDESGWIKQTMIHCLRLFRKENFGLSSVLEVFALEPVLDWLEQARKSFRCGSENPEILYAKQKITTVHQKLNGANPTTIFEEDLKAGHSESKYLDKYLEVLAGDEQHNVRARCPRQGLTEEDQVACLIDLATDPHVLAKTYVGWNPWL